MRREVSGPLWRKVRPLTKRLLIEMLCLQHIQGLVKNLTATAGDVSSIPGSERSPGEGNGSPLQYSYLENPMDRGTWRATVHGVTKSSTGLSD